MQRTPESSSAGQSRARLRSACNRCCAAKVRCSGERSGCQRCAATRLPCVYAESRVGKVSGIRARKRRPPLPESLPPPPRHHNHRYEASASASSADDEDADADAYHEPADLGRGDMFNWPSDCHLQSLSVADSITTTFPQEQQQQLPFDASSLQGQGGFVSGDTCVAPADVLDDFDDLGMAPSSTNPRSGWSGSVARDMEGNGNSNRGSGQRRAAPPSASSGELASECVQDCCQVINYLEAYINSQMNDFKIILGILRQVLGQLTNLISLQQGFPNPRCTMLFATILYQTLSLVEICLPHLSANKTQPRLGIASFALDAEELTLLRTRTLTKEMQRFIDATHKINTLAVKGPSLGLRDPSAADVMSSKTKADCFADLENRFNIIIIRTSGKK